MSFLSRHDKVFKRLIDRLELKTYQREPVFVPSCILPVTVVDELLDDLQPIEKESTTATEATHTHVVPTGKRHTIIGYSWTRQNAEAVGVKIHDPADEMVKLKSFTSAGNGEEFLSNPLVLAEGWDIEFCFAAGVEGALISRLMYREVDAF